MARVSRFSLFEWPLGVLMVFPLRLCTAKQSPSSSFLSLPNYFWLCYIIIPISKLANYLKWMASESACRFFKGSCDRRKADASSELWVREQKAVSGWALPTSGWSQKNGFKRLQSCWCKQTQWECAKKVGMQALLEIFLILFIFVGMDWPGRLRSVQRLNYQF